jgi:hypothetical protein
MLTCATDQDRQPSKAWIYQRNISKDERKRVLHTPAVFPAILGYAKRKEAARYTITLFHGR